MEIRVPKILKKLHGDEDTILIIQSSTNDISNLRNCSGRDKEAMAEKCTTDDQHRKSHLRFQLAEGYNSREGFQKKWDDYGLF